MAARLRFSPTFLSENSKLLSLPSIKCTRCSVGVSGIRSLQVFQIFSTIPLNWDRWWKFIYLKIVSINHICIRVFPDPHSRHELMDRGTIRTVREHEINPACLAVTEKSFSIFSVFSRRLISGWLTNIMTPYLAYHQGSTGTGTRALHYW